MSNLRDALALIHAGQTAQWQHHARRGRITGISIVQHAEYLRDQTGKALALVDDRKHLTHVSVPCDLAKGLREFIDEMAPGALSDRYVKQALAGLLVAIEEATAPAET
jgi:hypothetical protein